MTEQQKTPLIRVIDRKVQNQFDRILPANLTIRYILGLAIIGILSLAGHILIQASLFKLSSDEKTIRVLVSQVDDSESFYREIIRFQTISREAEFKHQLDTLDKNIINLIENHKSIMARLNQTGSFGLGFPKKINPYKKSVSDAFDKPSNDNGKIWNIKYLYQPNIPLNYTHVYKIN